MGTAANPLLGYYKWHARIYDATRWSFLFGRDRLVRLVAGMARPGADGLDIVEVGCGTGRNVRALARAVPGARLTGMDLCRPMLTRAERAVSGLGPGVRLVHGAYGPDVLPPASVDVVVFSYALSMFNPGLEAALDAARGHLRPGGLVAVVDFHSTPCRWFRAWMGVNHVRMDGHLAWALSSRFRPVLRDIRPAYAGLWYYFHWVGQAG
jgi:S-adenosylmethionine-diacylgycerolhomoserine-N-methlytransferase